MKLLAAVVALALLVAGCRHAPASPATSAPVTVTPPTGIVTADGHGWDAHGLYGPTYPAAACASPHTLAGQPLPDHICTPGAIDPAVTQDDIATKICVPGYTTTVRPPTSLTGPFRKVSATEYGVTLTPFELDHLVPLELGGASDTRNLWPEPGTIPNAKDHVESVLRQRVCSGAMTLADAQRRIATDWTTALQ